MENDDAPRAWVFATRAYEARRMIEGEDSVKTMKMKRAANHLSPQPLGGLDNAKLEDWLWMVEDVALWITSWNSCNVCNHLLFPYMLGYF
jgi:hypothetical protein